MSYPVSIFKHARFGIAVVNVGGTFISTGKLPLFVLDKIMDSTSVIKIKKYSRVVGYYGTTDIGGAALIIIHSPYTCRNPEKWDSIVRVGYTANKYVKQEIETRVFNYLKYPDYSEVIDLINQWLGGSTIEPKPWCMT
jgi:hypothetical protein